MTGLPAIEQRKWEREPRFYLSVYIGDKRKDTSKIVQRDSIAWNEYIEFFIPTPTPDSDLRLLLYRAHTVKEDEVIGTAEGKLGDLLGKRNREGKLPEIYKLEGYSILNTTDNNAENDVLEVIICVFEDEGLHRQAHLVNENTSRVIAGSSVAEHSLDPWVTLLDRIDIIVKITEKLSQVHPYAAMASSVLLGTYKIWKREQGRAKKIAELVEAMSDICNFTKDVPPEQDLKEQEKILDTMMRQIIDCGIFIQNYCKDGDAFLGKLIIIVLYSNSN
ncbi:hypothetical protein M422DRAFT_49110 [Sphaerobolus stellatus SS14]|uniref:C2 domain-containing protein n=1 Tax=Sphaerobolus stellatus (strain SS14) TaxID=990650 RepID=A0A0C9VGM1_SPHS4|nr:hypothetical protein M422DRAFT_49110 [Sphaerobolus stellatus SS14]